MSSPTPWGGANVDCQQLSSGSRFGISVFWKVLLIKLKEDNLPECQRMESFAHVKAVA